jgi:hypothetical protein
VCREVIPRKVIVVDGDTLDGDLSKDELFYSLTSMKNDKFPNVDCFPCGFFKEMWGIVGDDLYVQ